MAADTDIQLEVARGDVATTRVTTDALHPLEPGQVRLQIDRFALTANNITYAVAGDLLGYWDFFPAQAGWGRVPAMGWADITQSNHPDLAVGGRYFGWFPMGRNLTVQARPSASGFRDGGEHRTGHAEVYRSYTRADEAALSDPIGDAEDRHALLRGLFTTAYLADDFLADADHFGAGRIIVLSASSKTGIGVAQRSVERGLASVVGVTSARNVDFVRSLGCYTEVVTYDDVTSLDPEPVTVLVDMAGDGPVLERIHTHLDDRLRFSMTVGLSHHDAPRAAVTAGPEPQLFFAPSQVAKRIDDWGPDGYAQRLDDAFAEFADWIRSWLGLRHVVGIDALASIYADVVGGLVPPSVGIIASAHESV